MEENINLPEGNYKKVERPLRRIIINNFFGGIAWGLGVLIGTGIIISILAFMVSKINFIPIIGKFLADVIQSAQTHLITR